VAVCTRNRPVALSRCLASLGTQARLPDEVLVIDASDAPSETPSGVSLSFPLRLIPFEPSLVRQRNCAIEEANGEVLVFVDDDCELESGYLAAFSEAFTSEDVLGVAGRFLNPPAPKGVLRSLLADLFMIPSAGSGRFRLSTFPTVPTGTDERDVECFACGNMGVRTSIARLLRFDEALGDPATGFAYCEDDDFARRLARVGRIRYVPAAALWHNAQRQVGGDNPRLYASLVENAWYLRRKNWPPSRLTDVAFIWACLGLLLRYLVERRPAAAHGVLAGVGRLMLGRTGAIACHVG